MTNKELVTKRLRDTVELYSELKEKYVYKPSNEDAEQLELYLSMIYEIIAYSTQELSTCHRVRILKQIGLDLYTTNPKASFHCLEIHRTLTA